MKTLFSEIRYQVNPALDFKLVIDGIWWNIKSVMFEVLIFRGVIFYILLRKIGFVKAIIVSSIAFGIYHWFSFGVIGNAGAMVVVFFITGIMGLLYAYAYARTMSLYAPIAIHLGWNLMQNFIFSSGVIGDGVLIPSSTQAFRTDSYLAALLVFIMPMLSAVVINFLLLKRMKQIPLDIYENKKIHSQIET